MRHQVTQCPDDPIVLQGTLDQLSEAGWRLFQLVWRGANDPSGYRLAHYIIISTQE